MTESSDLNQRIIEKERDRQVDLHCIQVGTKSPEQVKQDNESFAFPRSRARINLTSYLEKYV